MPVLIAVLAAVLTAVPVPTVAAPVRVLTFNICGNVCRHGEVAATAGLTVWALTGPGPNPLAICAHDALCVPAATTATIQEVHLVVVHLLCSFLDEIVGCGSEG